MNVASLLSLGGLALIDSTSIGTLFIPVWLLMTPGRVAAGRILAYLGAIAGFYFVLGLVLLLGGARLVELFGGVWDSPPLWWAQLVLGVGLFLLSFRYDGKRSAGSDRPLRWRDRATSGQTSVRWLVGLAVLAALAEVATMLPYLAALGLLGSADVGVAPSVLLLAAYCLVMVLPAVSLLVLRMAGPDWVGALLARLDNWITRKAGSITGWVLGIVGFLLAWDAAARLGFVEQLLNR
ncbi:GAP family protein [Micromonospora sp. WMMD882]|uniref:GAP family protein n=1 Tax=Micromonospora sp. WMMD882 TaxID=3015151 RepID=UPI00248C0250|nr:GAP family protein [Micromonospora sp. WMMD882]WBB78372.1 GAP family protein [Micromonospora sp. WMMD882]